ncbi:uncharacterized protein HMPREF1541_01065 [Cyphellophora europaea CBS 101466]|uniref:EXPERA domain-containing protein n=1 Tax=Cyphellophora europaea (strain CBS 101466) TaxID=1220924 RepID=W2SDU3_CYPE1|nr:uncharacterized protein HMPREF1541_01065 [Cyphellophora europaea CBS 101466]ETN46876.1 hypothetical protein HMPREF1541_01065 [Cyphellophora europaea CBS 101466]
MDLLRKLSGQSAATSDPLPSHPYSPPSIAIPNFVPNDKDTAELLISFSAIWIPIFGVAWWMASRYNPSLKSLDKIILLWFVLCGCLHVFFEGYFVSTHSHIGQMQDLFGQLWKEYARSDSRYLTSDIFVLSAEGMSVAILGGLSWLMVYFIGTSSPYRHPVQIMLCMGHVYSDLLYYATATLDQYWRGVNHCRPEAYYFWVYFFGMNFIWIVVPTLLLFQSVFVVAKALSALDRMAQSMHSNGHISKNPLGPSSVKP